MGKTDAAVGDRTKGSRWWGSCRGTVLEGGVKDVEEDLRKTYRADDLARVIDNSDGLLERHPGGGGECDARYDRMEES
jgi:hypothetical protein